MSQPRKLSRHSGFPSPPLPPLGMLPRPDVVACNNPFRLVSSEKKGRKWKVAAVGAGQAGLD